MAPSAAKRTLGKHRFRFLHRERRGNVNWLALGFSAPWLVFLLMPLDSFLTTPELGPVRWAGVALVALFAVVNCSAYAVPWLVPVASTVRRSVIWTLLMALPVAGLTALRLEFGVSGCSCRSACTLWRSGFLAQSPRTACAWA